MKFFLNIGLLLTITVGVLSAQNKQVNYYQSKVLKKAIGETIDVSQIDADWAPSMKRLEMPPPGSGSYREYLRQLKKEISKKKRDRSKYMEVKSSSTPQPYLLGGFEGNIWSGNIPNDNDMAISNDGMLVSVINTNLYIFDVALDSMMKKLSLAAFADTLGITGGKYDPKVVYDPKLDKFIVVYLNGFSSSTSWIIVGFTETNDPTGNWNLYALSGNPMSTNVWSDYPMIAITDDELFITANFIQDDSSWQAGFAGSNIWQINKNSGYNGDSLIYRFYNDITYGGSGKYIRNLCPIQGGISTLGPNIYLLSNRNFDVENDSIFILEVTNILSDMGTVLQVDMSVSGTKYGVPPQARQDLSHTFETNDARILGGFLENNNIQFVGNSVVPGTGFAGVYHGAVTDLTGAKIVTGVLIGDDSLDFGYPNISFTGQASDDQQAIITFNHTSPSVFAGFSALYYRGDGTYSEILTIKEGENIVNVMSGKEERWGDYSGTQRRYNDPGKVWAVGSFGTRKKDQLGVYRKTNGTWIAELLTPDQVLFVSERQRGTDLQLKAFPNPVSGIINLEIDLKESATIEVLVYNIGGQLIKELFKDHVSTGKYGFYFSTDPLAEGVYMVIVKCNGNILSQKKIIKSNRN